LSATPILSAAFGFRNLADYDAGLREIVRVLRPGATPSLLAIADQFNSGRAGTFTDPHISF
jgi:ubiquinone/menaquinone biosynthesis C-methylase UbiE